MRRLLLMVLLFTPAMARAQAGARIETARPEVRLLGRLNVNLATRDELLQIPGLDVARVDELLAARSHGPLSTLAAFSLDAEVSTRLSTTGASTLRRIRPLPLEVFTTEPAAAAR